MTESKAGKAMSEPTTDEGGEQRKPHKCNRCGKVDFTVKYRLNPVAELNGVEVWVWRCSECWSKEEN